MRAAVLRRLEENMKHNTDKIDEATLALLYLVTWREEGGTRAWKFSEWETMDRLHKKSWISDTRNKAKSVAATDDGYQKAEDLFQVLCGNEGREAPILPVGAKG